jgi:hypothetical protein
MIEYKYMVSWYDSDPDATHIIPDQPVWRFWDGAIGEEGPPKRVKILLTGLVYTWQNFQKIKKKCPTLPQKGQF